MKTVTFQGGTPQNVPENQIEPFLNHLRAAGYAERTLLRSTSQVTAWMEVSSLATGHPVEVDNSREESSRRGRTGSLT